jgi:hypothetical protein
MLVLVAVICLAILALLLCCQLIWAWRFLRQFPPQSPPVVNDDELPRVVVVLPVRGADPSLIGCLRGLLSQDYPRYEVRIIIDSTEDPAWNLVHQILGRSHGARVQVSQLQTRRETCGLKTSALLQAIGTLDESCQVVALIDADVIPYAGWLRDLVLPLTNPEVGATTGIRWFIPKTANWGSLVRSLWNVAASVQMYALHIPWGGSLALREDVLRRSDLLQKWSVSLWEDTASYRTIRDLGLQLQFVPAATMVNRETTDLKNCFRFIRRQMLNVRLYHGGWQTILAHGMGTALTLAVTLGLSVVALAAGDGLAAALLIGGLILQVAGMALGLVCVERQVHRLLRKRSDAMNAISLKTLCALPLTHLVYFACLASASVLGKVSWRGITYEFDGPWTVRMRKYRPYRTRKTVDQGASVT